MNLTMRKDATAFGVNTSARFDHARIRALIDEATTDSNDESDEYAGLLSMIQEEVVCPFLIRVQGEDVECVRFEWPKKGYGLNAVCRTRKGKTRIVEGSKAKNPITTRVFSLRGPNFIGSRSRNTGVLLNRVRASYRGPIPKESQP
jgi:hypothetical protein